MALLESYVAEPPPLYETEQGAVRYYLRHRGEVDTYIARQELAAAEIRRKTEAHQPSNQIFQAKLKARLEEKNGKELEQ